MDDFLEAILAAPNDNTARLVYADWLEEKGDPRGAFLRLEVLFASTPATDTHFSEVEARFRESGTGIDSQWLALVSRTTIENCGVSLRFRCPLQWEHLQPMKDASVRFCESCRQQVFFCSSLLEAQTHAAVGDCIAVDPRFVRNPGDLESDFWDLPSWMPTVEELEPGDKDDAPPRTRQNEGRKRLNGV